MKHLIRIACALAAGLGHCGSVDAAFVQYTNKAQWHAAINNNYHTIDFTGFPSSTIITTQYANVGVNFTDGDDFIQLSDSYINDGAGLQGYFPFDNHITAQFSALQRWVAVDFPGLIWVKFYLGNTLLYSINDVGAPGVGNFIGVVSDTAFDRAVFYRPTDTAFIDDLFYNAVPAPGAWAIGLIGLAAASRSARRRRRL